MLSGTGDAKSVGQFQTSFLAFAKDHGFDLREQIVIQRGALASRKGQPELAVAMGPNAFASENLALYAARVHLDVEDADQQIVSRISALELLKGRIDLQNFRQGVIPVSRISLLASFAQVLSAVKVFASAA